MALVSFEDQPDILNLLSDVKVSLYTPFRVMENFRSVTVFIYESIQMEYNGNITIVVRTNSFERHFIGLIRLSVLDNSGEMGFSLLPSQWGRGLCAEAFTRVIKVIEKFYIGFKPWTICDAENEQAELMLAKLRLGKCVFLPAYRVHPAFGSKHRDCVLFCR